VYLHTGNSSLKKTCRKKKPFTVSKRKLNSNERKGSRAITDVASKATKLLIVAVRAPKVLDLEDPEATATSTSLVTSVKRRDTMHATARTRRRARKSIASSVAP
jgi:hypothetical protein